MAVAEEFDEECEIAFDVASLAFVGDGSRANQSSYEQWGCPMRAVIVAMLFGVVSATAQTTTPAFEVASIKLNHSSSGNSSTNMSGGTVVIENQSLKQLIEKAFDVRDFSLSGPGWLETVYFDIVAKPPAGTPPNQVLLMLQRLLEERLNVRVHGEKKTVAGYALILANKNPTLEPADVTPGESIRAGDGQIDAKAISMITLADMLSRRLEQPVQDMTQLPANYRLKLRWTADEAAAKGLDEPPPLFTALQEQLGLKLLAQKVTIQVLVVDHADKVPSDN